MSQQVANTTSRKSRRMHRLRHLSSTNSSSNKSKAGNSNSAKRRYERIQNEEESSEDSSINSSDENNTDYDSDLNDYNDQHNTNNKNKRAEQNKTLSVTANTNKRSKKSSATLVTIHSNVLVPPLKKRKLSINVKDQRNKPQPRRKSSMNNNNKSSSSANKNKTKSKKGDTKKQKTFTLNKSGQYATILHHCFTDLGQYSRIKKQYPTQAAKQIYKYIPRPMIAPCVGPAIVYNLINGTQIKWKQNGVPKLQTTGQTTNVYNILKMAIECNGQIDEVRKIREEQKEYDPYINNRHKWITMHKDGLITKHERDVMIKRDVMIMNCLKYDAESKTGIDVDAYYTDLRNKYTSFYEGKDGVYGDGDKLYWSKIVTREDYEQYKQTVEAPNDADTQENDADTQENDDLCPPPVGSLSLDLDDENSNDSATNNS